jgi:hypothetical protein
VCSPTKVASAGESAITSRRGSAPKLGPTVSMVSAIAAAGLLILATPLLLPRHDRTAGPERKLMATGVRLDGQRRVVRAEQASSRATAGAVSWLGECVARQRGGGERGHVTGDREHVLDRDRQAVQRPRARPARDQRRWWTSWSPYTGVARPACRALSCRAR